MHLPEELQEAIALEADKFKLREMQTAREQLTERYRSAHSAERKGTYIESEAERCAYLVARLPATYAVISRVLQELIRRTEGATAIHSLLDLGAGPGTAMWAASQVLTEVTRYSLVEQDEILIALGKRLAAQAQNPPLSNVRWFLQKMEDVRGIDPHDLVILSYSIGEIHPNAIQPVIERCLQLTNRYLIVIEPGTCKGFELLRAIRMRLIESGCHLVAPCPHAAACPMQGGNWCHFSERIERSALHRRIKSGTLGYEDEKFSYLIFSKDAVTLPEARVLRHPQKRSGHVSLELCTSEGLKQQMISKRTPEEYKRAKRLEWGSSIENTR